MTSVVKDETNEEQMRTACEDIRWYLITLENSLQFLKKLNIHLPFDIVKMKPHIHIKTYT